MRGVNSDENLINRPQTRECSNVKWLCINCITITIKIFDGQSLGRGCTCDKLNFILLINFILLSIKLIYYTEINNLTSIYMFPSKFPWAVTHFCQRQSCWKHSWKLFFDYFSLSMHSSRLQWLPWRLQIVILSLFRKNRKKIGLWSIYHILWICHLLTFFIIFYLFFLIKKNCLFFYIRTILAISSFSICVRQL